MCVDDFIMTSFIVIRIFIILRNAAVSICIQNITSHLAMVKHLAIVLRGSDMLLSLLF